MFTRLNKKSKAVASHRQDAELLACTLQTAICFDA